MTSLGSTRGRRTSRYGHRVHLLSGKPRARLLLAVDVVIALVLGGIVGYSALDADQPGGWTEPLWLSIVAVVLISAPVAVRRLWPVPALAVELGAVLASLASGVIPVVALGAPLSATAFVIYLVAATQSRRESVITLVVSLAGLSATVLVNRPYESWEDSLFGLVFGWLVVTGGWTIGLTTRERRLFIEQSAAQRAQQAVAEERLRIARELHDIVAHSMSLIAVKAGIGNHVARQRPEEARDALRVIEATSRSSLTEMRHLLGVLRSEVDGPMLAPAPGVAGIPDLAERARSAGVVVSVELADLSALPEGMGLSVYRIVQEALTNVVRHAGRARCAVRVEAADGEVRIVVTNDGPKVGEPATGGHGLIGMRERVAVYGGTFEAGVLPVAAS
jgi:signal transduction histidine kinase